MERQKKVAMKIFKEICDNWGLDKEERDRLLGDPESQILRISHMMSIYRCLHTIYDDKNRANAWVRKPNRKFGGRSALAAMIEDPEQVQKYLETHL
jgi:hypothetical protein